MGLIENTKTYTGNDLETIFFRPILNGEYKHCQSV